MGSGARIEYRSHDRRGARIFPGPCDASISQKASLAMELLLSGKESVTARRATASSSASGSVRMDAKILEIDAERIARLPVCRGSRPHTRATLFDDHHRLPSVGESSVLGADSSTKKYLGNPASIELIDEKFLRNVAKWFLLRVPDLAGMTSQ